MADLACAWLRTVFWLNARFKSAAVRLTQLTGKSSVPIHPKHLIDVDLGQRWYLYHVEPGMRVLDVGCGNGTHGIRTARKGARVIAVDYDAGNLKVGQTLRVEAGIDTISFLVGNAEEALPVGAGQFDLVLLLDVIEHLNDRRQLLRQVHRVLCPGGKLVLSAPNRDTSWKRRLETAGLPHYTDPDHKVEYTQQELCAELEAGGFELLGELVPIVYDTPWAGAIDLVGGLSLGLYARLSRWKAQQALRYPNETTGWRVVCRRMGP